MIKSSNKKTSQSKKTSTKTLSTKSSPSKTVSKKLQEYKPKISYSNSLFSRYINDDKIITIEIHNNNGEISGKYTEEDKKGKIIKDKKITKKNIEKYEKLIK